MEQAQDMTQNTDKVNTTSSHTQQIVYSLMEPGQQYPTGLPTKIRGISIRQLDKGYVISVGCQEFAINDSKTLIKNLIAYIKNPSATEEKYYKGELFK